METNGALYTSPSAPRGGPGLGSQGFVDVFALHYHLAVAERLRESPEEVVNHAHGNIRRWMINGGSAGGESPILEEWQGLLDSSSVEQLIEIITEESDEGQRLRSSSPFVGVITPEERLEILTCFEQGATA